MSHVKIGEDIYADDHFSDAANRIATLLKSAEDLMLQKINERAVMTMAMNAYIKELKNEVVEHKSGLDLSSLLE